MTIDEILQIALQKFQISDRNDINFKIRHLIQNNPAVFQLPDMCFVTQITAVLTTGVGYIKAYDKDSSVLLDNAIKQEVLIDSNGVQYYPMDMPGAQTVQFQNIGFVKHIDTNSSVQILYIEITKIR